MPDPEQPKTLTAFGAELRRLRKTRGVTHRAIATAAGMAAQTSCNCETMPHKVVKRERVERIADFHGLSRAERDRLLALWEALPASAYAERQQTSWSKRRQFRAKAKHHDVMQVALVEVVSLLLDHVPGDGNPCMCPPPDPFAGEPSRPCEICNALQVLGHAPGWNGMDPVVAFLAQLQESLAPTA